ncbi:MAG: GNAT family N-acetyltransferase, partial [Janthinobacterium sp.]
NAGQPETEEDTRAAVKRITGRWAEWGYSWWALIRLDDGEMVGMACLQHLGGDKTKPHEIGWRLARTGWGQGYASEAAAAIVRHAQQVLRLRTLYGITSQQNQASINLLNKLGLRFERFTRRQPDGKDTNVYRRDFRQD